MGSLFFPQLSTGALAQYPVRRARLGRSIRNILPSGDLILAPDPDATTLVWQLAYSALPTAEIGAIQNLFQTCAGPVHAFTFIDPVDNMLAGSTTLSAPAWMIPGFVSVSTGAPDPMGTMNGFLITNTGQAAAALTQTLTVPAWYTYCFSLYVTSNQPSSIALLRQGQNAQSVTSSPIGMAWTRIVSSGALSDASTTLTVGIQLSAGQQVTIYGPQLEPQPSPSRYRPTAQRGGVYSKAHWGADQLLVTAEAPDLFSTTFTIETSIQD